MPATHSNTTNPADPRWRALPKGLLLLLAMVTLAYTLSRCQESVGQNLHPAGYRQGFWHGAIMPCAMPLLLFGRDVSIYATLNTGRSYKLGYTMGVNVCGLIFFGLFFARLGRWRKRLSTRNQPVTGPPSSESLPGKRLAKSDRQS